MISCTPILRTGLNSVLTSGTPLNVLMSDLRGVLTKVLQSSGMPKTVADQKDFIQTHQKTLQAWLNNHLKDLTDSAERLPLPELTQRYGRNLILSVPESGIYAFLHRLNTATPEHWHCEGEMSALAFACALTKGVVEVRWDAQPQGNIVQLTHPTFTEVDVGEFGAIAGDYGVHVMSNTNQNGPASLFEIYFEPQELNFLTVPIPVLYSKTGEHYVHNLPTKWLPDQNLYQTAIKEHWPAISKIPTGSTVFTVVNGKTFFVPKELLIEQDARVILQGPGNRILLIF